MLVDVDAPRVADVVTDVRVEVPVFVEVTVDTVVLVVDEVETLVQKLQVLSQFPPSGAPMLNKSLQMDAFVQQGLS